MYIRVHTPEEHQAYQRERAVLQQLLQLNPDRLSLDAIETLATTTGQEMIRYARGELTGFEPEEALRLLQNLKRSLAKRRHTGG